MIQLSNVDIETIDFAKLSSDPFMSCWSPNRKTDIITATPLIEDPRNSPAISALHQDSSPNLAQTTTNSVPSDSGDLTSRSFSDSSSYRVSPQQRRFKHHARKHKVYACDLCPASYPHPKSLREHRQTKHEGIRYFCNIDGCRKSVAQKKNLARHKAMKHRVYINSVIRSSTRSLQASSSE